MRLALSCCLVVLRCMLVSTALGACADDGPAGSGAFRSPYGELDSGVVCGADSYLKGYVCVSRTSLLDASATHADADVDAQGLLKAERWATERPLVSVAR